MRNLLMAGVISLAGVVAAHAETHLSDGQRRSMLSMAQEKVDDQASVVLVSGGKPIWTATVDTVVSAEMAPPQTLREAVYVLPLRSCGKATVNVTPGGMAELDLDQVVTTDYVAFWNDYGQVQTVMFRAFADGQFNKIYAGCVTHGAS